jgi:hypothetical protein
MSMSKKHFVALAVGIKQVVQGLPAGAARRAAAQITTAVANVCRTSNVNFKFDRFWEACGFTTGEES